MSFVKLLTNLFLFRSGTSTKSKMNWNQLTSEEQLEEIKKESQERPVMIFKHSTSCPISTTSLARMERGWKEDEAKNIKIYYLDLLSNRSLSNAVALEFNVEHQSPQVILIKNGERVYDESHFGISFQDLVSVA
jgi:bacillithiol system protein YtxJ